jgi:hypothetical protein
MRSHEAARPRAAHPSIYVTCHPHVLGPATQPTALSSPPQPHPEGDPLESCPWPYPTRWNRSFLALGPSWTAVSKMKPRNLGPAFDGTRRTGVGKPKGRRQQNGVRPGCNRPAVLLLREAARSADGCGPMQRPGDSIGAGASGSAFPCDIRRSRGPARWGTAPWVGPLPVRVGTHPGLPPELPLGLGGLAADEFAWERRRGDAGPFQRKPVVWAWIHSTSTLPGVGTRNWVSWPFRSTGLVRASRHLWISECPSANANDDARLW